MNGYFRTVASPEKLGGAQSNIPTRDPPPPPPAPIGATAMYLKET